jgi:glycosyltransferase 2 family protein
MSLTQSARRHLTHGRIQAALLVLGLGGMAIAVIGLRNDLRGHALPGVPTMLLALALGVSSLVAAARGWITLLAAAPGDRRAVSHAMYVSQLSKYLPGGGVFQATGQITLSAAAHRPAKRVAVAFVVSAISQAAAGFLIVTGIVTLDGAPGWIRWLAPLGLLGLLGLSRPVLHLMMRIGRRITRHVPESDHLPPERAVAIGFLWSLINIGLFALSYAVILHSIEPGTPILGATSAFALAWVIGFLVLPIPSGLGIREAVLYATLPGVPAAAVLASSLAHRVATFGAEVLLTVISQARKRKQHPAPVEADALAS